VSGDARIRVGEIVLHPGAETDERAIRAAVERRLESLPEPIAADVAEAVAAEVARLAREVRS
jgi:hypothetical protein